MITHIWEVSNRTFSALFLTKTQARNLAGKVRGLLCYRRDVFTDDPIWLGEYYLQDSRTTLGNDMLFWRKDGKGYTTNLNEAQIYSLKAAMELHERRETDIPWHKEFLDKKSHPAVDTQNCNRSDYKEVT